MPHKRDGRRQRGQLCGHVEMRRGEDGQIMEKEVGWTVCMRGGLIKLMQGLIEVTGDARRGGWIVGDVKCRKVRSMESGVRVDRWSVR